MKPPRQRLPMRRRGLGKTNVTRQSPTNSAHRFLKVKVELP
jgi:hypothetical protein